MEFRYRAVDKDHPSTTTDTASSQPPNPTLSLYPTRPMLGKSEDHVREAIQREIEKEQIRQEIIAAETSRRRELIAEVLQEMAVEREMAIRRVVDEKQTMWNNQKHVPNQNHNNDLFGQMYTNPYSLVTSPMLQQMPEITPELEPKKDKLIMLERADHVGAKRKAEDTQTSDERAKKCMAGGVGLAREEWSFTVLKAHLHQEKEAALKANPISASNDTAVETGERVSSKVESKPKRNFEFWCDVCNIGTDSQKVMRDHELGKKHIAAVKKQNEQPDTSSTSIITTPASATSPSLGTITVLQNVNVAAIETGKKTVGKKKKKKKEMVIIRCETCNIYTCSEKVMEDHKLGKKHKALLEKQKHKALAVLDTNVMTAPVRSLNADPEEKL